MAGPLVAAAASPAPELCGPDHGARTPATAIHTVDANCVVAHPICVANRIWTMDNFLPSRLFDMPPSPLGKRRRQPERIADDDEPPRKRRRLLNPRPRGEKRGSRSIITIRNRLAAHRPPQPHMAQGAAHMAQGATHAAQGAAYTHMAAARAHMAQGATHMAQGATHMAQGATHAAQGAAHTHTVQGAVLAAQGAAYTHMHAGLPAHYPTAGLAEPPLSLLIPFPPLQPMLAAGPMVLPPLVTAAPTPSRNFSWSREPALLQLVAATHPSRNTPWCREPAVTSRILAAAAAVRAAADIVEAAASRSKHTISSALPLAVPASPPPPPHNTPPLHTDLPMPPLPLVAAATIRDVQPAAAKLEATCRRCSVRFPLVNYNGPTPTTDDEIQVSIFDGLHI